MGNKAELESFFSQEPMDKRTPADFTKNLEALWLKHIVPETNEKNPFFQNHLTYQENKHLFYIAYEYLFKSGVSLVNSIEDLEKPFKGISVCTVGGIEGRIMAEMGASAVNIDPNIKDAPKLDLPNLSEIARPLDEELSHQYAGQFDMILSSGLIDNESGFTDGIPASLIPKHSRDFFLLLLNLLKQGGLAVLRGNLVHAVLRGTYSLISIKEIIPYTKNETIKSPDVIFVIQKK